MRVNHEDLGLIDITVSRVGNGNADTLAINIGAHSLEGKNFFSQNSKELFTHLTTAGITVSDLKVETPTQTAKNDFDFGSQNGRQGQNGSEKQFGSEQNQRRHEQERRQDLWKLLSKEAA
jgi:tRNA U34 5-carboxymethylaminomethyl modifying enzyme MnmG/GidA